MPSSKPSGSPSDTPSGSRSDSKSDPQSDRYHSEYVPEFRSEEERQRWKESMLDELREATQGGHLRPVSGQPPVPDPRMTKE